MTNPGVRLRVGHQHSQFWLILVHFLDYYPLFWGPRAIFTIEDPRGAFTCPSSTLTVLANSDPFRGLLITVLGSGVISTIGTPQGAFMCRPSTHNFGWFWPVSWVITHCVGFGSDHPDWRTPGCVYVSAINTHFLLSLARFVDYCSLFRVPN